MAGVDEEESVRQGGRGFFNLVVASKTYHEMFANVNLLNVDINVDLLTL